MSDPVVLSAAGVGLVLDVAAPGCRGSSIGAPIRARCPRRRPARWPVPPSPPAAAVDGADPWGPLPLLPAQWDGWAGRHGATGIALRPVAAPAAGVDGTGDGRRRRADGRGGRPCRRRRGPPRVSLTPQGVVMLRHTLTNTGADELVAVRAAVPAAGSGPGHRAARLHRAVGAGTGAAAARVHNGTHARESRRGRTGHDAATLLVAGVPGFSFGAGEVWAVHIGWSGDHEHYAERLPGAVGVLGGGELLAPGEVRLGPGETYTTPEAYFAWSGAGLDGLSERLHRHAPGPADAPALAPAADPQRLGGRLLRPRPRPADRARDQAAADRGGAVRARRRLVPRPPRRHRRPRRLGGRRSGVAGRPDPLVDHVRARGMQFGLWFEPEMVNPDSDLARAHPDWILAAPGRLARPGAPAARPRPRPTRGLRPCSSNGSTRWSPTTGIDYIKWDHNRDLLEAAPRGTAGVHAQTLAVYQLLDQLRARHPGLEIESCSSGGGRVDLGILARTDRVWASDSNDAVDRQRIQRWTGLLLPPELVGSHVGPSPAHTTGGCRPGVPLRHRAVRPRRHRVGHHPLHDAGAGRCSPTGSGSTRRTRAMLHTGRTVRVDLPDPSAHLYGVVADDRSAALFVYAQLDSALELRPPCGCGCLASIPPAPTG